MELVTPGIGLIFWMFLSFLLVFTILRKYAWRPILQTLKKREESIDEALSSAEKARNEFELLQKENKEIIAKAKSERDTIFNEAQKVKEKVIRDAKEQASVEAKKIIEAAQAAIQSEKLAALDDIKKEITTLSVEIAERILKQKLQDDDVHKSIIDNTLKDLKFN